MQRRLLNDLLRSVIFSLVLLVVFAIPFYSPFPILGIYLKLPAHLVVDRYLPEQTCDDPEINRLQEKQLTLESRLQAVEYESSEWHKYKAEQDPVLDDLRKAQDAYWECHERWYGTHPPRSFYGFMVYVVSFLLYAGIAFTGIRIVRVIKKLSEKKA